MLIGFIFPPYGKPVISTIFKVIVVEIRVVNLRLDKLGRAVLARILKWAEPGRYGPKFQVARPKIYNPVE